MKTPQFFLFMIATTAFVFQSCMKDNCESTVSYIQLEPVYKSLEEIHAGGIVKEAPRLLENPGQFYYYDNHIFINERGEGIHVIDNTNPSNPVGTEFLAINGNEDLAIKDGYLYANTYIDLLVIDLSNFEIVGRVENAFEPEWNYIENGQLLVDWLEVPKTEVVDCQTYSAFEKRGGEFYYLEDSFGANIDNVVFDNNSNHAVGGETGTGGSMARFTIMSDYLYALENDGMKLFELTNPTAPTNIGEVNIGWGIETIFPYEDKLFIGSNSGMFIYDNSIPTQPTLLSEFAHANACDPVFVKGNHAYVTLRSGNACAGFTNQLDLIDITDLTAPELLKTFPMENPHGLSIKDDYLFLCEGEFGVKSFDISDPLILDENQLDHEKGFHAFDAISLPGNSNLVLFIGDDGFYQYTYNQYGELEELSKISIVNK